MLTSVRWSTLVRSPNGMPARPRACWPSLTGFRRVGTGMCCAAWSITYTAYPMNPEVLVGMLAELEGIRELTLDLVERSAPPLLPAPPTDADGTERTLFELLLGVRRAVLGNPVAARGLHDLLVAEGRRYADTPAEPHCGMRSSHPKRSRISGEYGRR